MGGVGGAYLGYKSDSVSEKTAAIGEEGLTSAYKYLKKLKRTTKLINKMDDLVGQDNGQ